MLRHALTTCRYSDKAVASVVAGLLWDRVGHPSVFYYGAIFGVGGIALLLFIPGEHEPPGRESREVS